MGLSRKLGIIGVVLFVFGVSFGFVVIPRMLKSKVIEASSLKHGNVLREMWAKVPFPLDFNVYVFNVTNPTEVSNGEKPILRQVGPYFYEEWIEKVDLVDHEEDDTLEYSRKRTFIFNPARSKPLTGNEIVTVPHLFILSIAMVTMRDRPNMIGLAGKAIDSIFHKPDSVFVETSVHDFLFGGLPIDCNVTDFAGSATCTYLKDSPELIRDGEKRYKVSVFGHVNGTVDAKRIRVKRGIKDITQVGQVTEFKGQTEQTVWPKGSRCNLYNGTDGTIVRPYLFEHEEIVSFSPDMCRTFSTSWDGTYTSVGGLRTNHYTFSFGDLSNEPEWNCYCSTNDTCTKKGLYDLFKCVGAPMVISLPHFYQVDKTYLKQVVGLRPSKKAHQIDFDFEPVTGTPISGRNRAQFSMFVFPIAKLKIMKTFATALLPFFWIDENVTVPDEYLDDLRMLFMVMGVVDAVRWIMIIFGMALCGAGAGMKYMMDHVGMRVTVLSLSGNDGSSEKARPLADKVPPRYIDSD